jgi:hypothetical protein
LEDLTNLNPVLEFYNNLCGSRPSRNRIIVPALHKGYIGERARTTTRFLAAIDCSKISALEELLPSTGLAEVLDYQVLIMILPQNKNFYILK